jgi:elongation factor Ts
MADITPAMIKELRDKTGLGLKKCKEALVESDGNIELAIEALRKSGMASAEKRMGRTTSQGSVFTYTSEDSKTGAIVELGCETDFVAKTADFKNLGLKLATFTATHGIANADALNAATIDGVPVSEIIKENISKLGENLSIKSVQCFKTSGRLYQYIHGEGALLGVMLNIEGADDHVDSLGKDICMHIAASMPIYLDRNSVPAEIIEKEKEIFREQMSDKPSEVVEKILVGKINKFYQDNCVIDQPFIKDDKKTVAKVLAEAGAKYKIASFARFQIGA